MSNTITQTQRKPNSLSKTKRNNKNKDKDKSELWGQFDEEIKTDNSVSIECVYRSCGARENCDVCD